VSVQFVHEIEQLNQRLLKLSALVEQQLHTAITALHDRNRENAAKVIARDREVDQHEVANEEECLKILALYQPVAADLRFIVSVLKINNDLERIGDLAANVARKALVLADHTDFTIPVNLQEMAQRAESMLNQAVNALIKLDDKAARQVCAMDDAVNKMKREVRRVSVTEIEKQPQHADLLLRVIGASRNLERIADLATNIAEDVIYLAEGHIARHGDITAG